MTSKEILVQFLENNKLMQLASQKDGNLWICNLYFASDKDGNIYWTSARHRRHSVEIEANPIVAATIVNDEDKKQAIQISGKAYRVPVEESETVDLIYGAKFGHKDSRLSDIKTDTPSSRAYWVLKPEVIELWDEVNFPGNAKQPVEL